MIPELLFIPIVFGLIALVAWQQQQFGLREKEWTRERSQLLSRIQHPEIVQVQPEELLAESDYNVPAPMPMVADDIDLVGTVQTFDGNSD